MGLAGKQAQLASARRHLQGKGSGWGTKVPLCAQAGKGEARSDRSNSHKIHEVCDDGLVGGGLGLCYGHPQPLTDSKTALAKELDQVWRPPLSLTKFEVQLKWHCLARGGEREIPEEPQEETILPEEGARTPLEQPDATSVNLSLFPVYGKIVFHETTSQCQKG